MHDPLTVAFEIHGPCPRIDKWRTRRAAEEHTRWRFGAPYSVLFGRALSWPTLVTVWHRDPSGHDSTTCPTGGRAWRWHIHHWRIQVPPLQQLRRRILTRCAWCGGRSVKGDQVKISRSWDGPRARWWQGESGLYHRDCSAIKTAHATCFCEQPGLEYDDYGRCARCNRTRAFGTTVERITRARELSSIPRGARTTPTPEAPHA